MEADAPLLGACGPPPLGPAAQCKLMTSQQRAAARRCQAEGCCVALESQSKYAQKSRICDLHLKAEALHRCGDPTGQLWRFCQQCGKLEELANFDSNKRSCRERLRMRRVQSRKAGHHDPRAKRHHAAGGGDVNAAPWEGEDGLACYSGSLFPASSSDANVFSVGEWAMPAGVGGRVADVASAPLRKSASHGMLLGSGAATASDSGGDDTCFTAPNLQLADQLQSVQQRLAAVTHQLEQLHQHAGDPVVAGLQQQCSDLQAMRQQQAQQPQPQQAAQQPAAPPAATDTLIPVTWWGHVTPGASTHIEPLCTTASAHHTAASSTATAFVNLCSSTVVSAPLARFSPPAAPSGSNAPLPPPAWPLLQQHAGAASSGAGVPAPLLQAGCCPFASAPLPAALRHSSAPGLLFGADELPANWDEMLLEDLAEESAEELAAAAGGAGGPAQPDVFVPMLVPAPPCAGRAHSAPAVAATMPAAASGPHTGAAFTPEAANNDVWAQQQQQWLMQQAMTLQQLNLRPMPAAAAAACTASAPLAALEVAAAAVADACNAAGDTDEPMAASEYEDMLEIALLEAGAAALSGSNAA